MSINKTKLTKSIQDRGQYFTAPNEIWTLPISIKAKTAYLYLLAQSDKWNPSLKKIAEAMSMSVNSARAAVRELESVNMISIVNEENGHKNYYTFNSLEDWTLPTSAPAVSVQTPVRTSSNSAPVASADSAGDQFKFCTGAGSPVARIQEESKTNPTIYLTRQMDGKRGKVNSFEEQEYLAWRAHYLKSSYYETLFDSLSLKDKLAIQQIQDKEECLTFLNTFRQTTCEDISVEL